VKKADANEASSRKKPAHLASDEKRFERFHQFVRMSTCEEGLVEWNSLNSAGISQFGAVKSER